MGAGMGGVRWRLSVVRCAGGVRWGGGGGGGGVWGGRGGGGWGGGGGLGVGGPVFGGGGGGGGGGGEEVGFELGDLVELPGEVGELADEDLLDGGGGAELFH